MTDLHILWKTICFFFHPDLQQIYLLIDFKMFSKAGLSIWCCECLATFKKEIYNTLVRVFFDNLNCFCIEDDSSNSVPLLFMVLICILFLWKYMQLFSVFCDFKLSIEQSLNSSVYILFYVSSAVNWFSFMWSHCIFALLWQILQRIV